MGDFQQNVAIEQNSYGTESHPSTQDEVECAAPTGINVLIIGAGVGGVAAALECHRKGHTVRVLERSARASAEGDMFTIGASALRLLDRYPSMKREYDEIAVQNLWLRYRKWTGEDLGDPFPFAAGAKGAEENSHADRPPITTVLRPLFHAMLYHQLDRFNIKVQLDTNVREFYEDVDRGLGGVVTDQGERFEADLVIAADGLHSKSHALIPNAPSAAEPTGRTIFRCAFPLETAVADPLVAETFGLLNGKDPLMQVWLGPETHAVVLAYADKHGQNGRLCFGISFREGEDNTEDESRPQRKETWNGTVSSDEVLAIMDRLPDWSEAMKQLLRITPDKQILGDAAHPFLPTSGNGATQAIEDAITIATCLARAAAANPRTKDSSASPPSSPIPTAVQTHTLLRTDRVACAQLLGFVNAARVQKTDFAQVGRDASRVQHRIPKWIWGLDAEVYAEEFYERAAASLEGGAGSGGGNEKGFKNENIPSGYTPKAWTVDDVEELQRAGRGIELEGDWS